MENKSSRTFDLLTLGQVLLRLSPPDNERLSRGDTFVKQVGGAELNVAVGASLLGLHTGVISKLPAHDIGSFMKGKSAPSALVMISLCMTIPRAPDLESTIMRTALIPESPKLSMTGSIVPSFP